MISPIYWHPLIYKTIIRLLYGKEYKSRYKIIAKEIDKLNVLDLCCGDCEISNYIKKEKYKGIDFNKAFVKYSKNKGLDVSYEDINKCVLFKEDCILMQGSLYHFFPNHERILKKMLNSSIKKTIISEPINNITHSQNFLFKTIARFLSKTKTGSYKKRFTRKELLNIAKKFKANKIIEMNKDLIMVFDK